MPINNFRLNIKSVRQLDKIYLLIKDKLPLLEEDLSEILRAEIVLAVSALDCYIHDLVRVEIVQTYDGRKPVTKQIDEFSIPLLFAKSIDNSISLADKLSFLDNAIRHVNSSDSFQSPRSIEKALGIINLRKIWSSISPEIGISADDIQKRLSLIIYRRNKIAHESDLDYLTGVKNPINHPDTVSVVNFIEQYCEAIDSIK
jgi:hypothetical protein